MLKNKFYLSSVALIMLNIATVTSMLGLPSASLYGISSIFLYFLALVLFLVPISLICAELGAMFPSEGGIYLWVSKALGYRVGIFATWLQWVQSLFFYPLSLTFAAVTCTYIIPNESIRLSLSNNTVYIISFILIAFFGCTLISLLGLSKVARLSVYGILIGIIIPASLLFLFMIFFYLFGNISQININLHNAIPNFTNIDQLVMAGSILVFFSGMEVNAAHIKMMKNPTKDYPIALMFTCIILFIIYVTGTLSISVIVPKDEINITRSVIVALEKYVTYFNMSYLTPVIAFGLSLGVLTKTLTWINGPTSVIKYIADQGLIPSIFQLKNKNESPIFILIIQAIIVTLIVLLYLFSSHIQSIYQMLMQMTNALYLTMYVILFITFIKLRIKNKDLNRPFMAGKSNFKAFFIAFMGLFSSIVTIILCFLPPEQLGIENKQSYIYMLLLIYSTMTIPVLVYLIFTNSKSKLVK